MNQRDIVNGREVSAKIVLVLILVGLLVAIARVSYWSFEQTWEFAKIFDDPKNMSAWTSLAFGAIIQYGQNPALWWFFAQKKIRDGYKRQISSGDKSLFTKQKYENATYSMFTAALIFFILSIIDAMTNIGQFGNDHPTLYLVSPLMYWTGVIFCIVIVLVEEAFSFVLNVLFHVINDIREAYGLSRWERLDAFDPSLIFENKPKSYDKPIESQPSYKSQDIQARIEQLRKSSGEPPNPIFRNRDR